MERMMNSDNNWKIMKKTRQNTENKQTFDLIGNIENEGKSRQNAENKQTFDLMGKFEIEGKKLVKTLKINKLLID